VDSVKAAVFKTRHYLNKSVYYLTGMDGRFDKGLGEAISARGYRVAGRELIGEFKKLEFQAKIDFIANDLLENHWSEDANVIANSFGAYLFLHAQAQMDPYPGSVILLSPIVGKFSNSTTGIGFIPPRAKKLAQLVSNGEFPAPHNCRIHVGSEDWQSNPEDVEKLGIKTMIVPNAGHRLPIDYVSNMLDSWLRE
jgi:alpha-beta hydrolase superfamily lysophospholipase